MSALQMTKNWWLFGLLFLASLGWGYGQDGDPKDQAAPPKSFKRAVIIPISGPLTPMTESSFKRRLAEAKRMHADLVVIELDSPGGFVDTSFDIADRLLRVDWARTVALVPQQAMSGAAIVSLGCDEILVASTAQFGDAGMITQILGEGVFRYAPEKERSAYISRIRTLAAEKGRPPALAQALMDMDLQVFRVRNTQTGVETFMSDAEITASANSAHWEKLEPVFETQGKNFLTMNGTRAVELKLAQATLGTRAELAKRFNLANEFVVLEHKGVDTTVLILNHPLITGFIFVIGLIALYFEFQFPGTFVGGLIAALCFAIFFWSRFLGGTAGWLEVILFIAGLTFVGMEIFVIPGFGIAGISGILLLVASVIMASQSFVIPNTSRELDTTLTQLGIVCGSGILFVVSAAILTRYLGALPVMRALVLEVPPASDADKPTGVGTGTIAAAVLPSVPVKLGQHGLADSPLRPAGKARFGDYFADVISDGDFIDRHKPIRVIEIAGNRIVVREVEDPKALS